MTSLEGGYGGRRAHHHLRDPTFCAGFALSQADRSVVCLIFIFAMILTSLIFGFLSTNASTSASNAATRTHIVFRDHGNNSQIWFRDESLVSEPNRSAAAREREPSLIVALEKLRLTHLQYDTSESSANVGIGEHDDGTWRRQSQISSLWRKVINNGDDIRHVCHIGLGGGFPAVLYLEALPNATVSVFDACQGDDSNRTCDVVEQFLQLNYAANRFRLVRANDVARRLVLDVRGYWPTANAGDMDAAFNDPVWGPVRDNDAAARNSDSYHSHDKIAGNKSHAASTASSDESGESTRKGEKVDKPPITTVPPEAAVPGTTPQSAPCDWIGIDLRGDTDTPSGLLKILRPAVACPNIVFMNNVGHESADEKLTKLAMEWDAGVESRVSMQSRCEPCYTNDFAGECTFCYGHFLCGALAAAQEDELKGSSSDSDGKPKKGKGSGGSSSVFIRPSSPAEPDAKVDPDIDTGESDNSKEVSDSSTDSDSVEEKQALLNDEDDKQEAMQ